MFGGEIPKSGRMGMALGLDKIEALAPDQSSLDAAKKLLKANGWPTLAEDQAGLIWGECQGSGATPYRVVVAEADAGYKCSCPSRKFPCKHALALMWMRADGKATFTPAPAPDWVNDWLSRRRGPGVAAPVDAAKPKASLAAVSDEAEAAPDPKAEARAAAARERNRSDREAAIAAGLDDLDTWLSDQVDKGLASFANSAGTACRLMAQRLVDAKASGLATRVDALPSRLFALPDMARPQAAVEELGVLHLLAEAYRRQDSLTADLRSDVRQMVGWSLTREGLLADEAVERVTGSWRVIATVSEVQPDRLRRLETWLFGAGQLGSGQFAVLIDYVPVATGAASSGYSVGDRFEAELAFYPSPSPLRALIVRQLSGAVADGAVLDVAAGDLSTAYGVYERALAARPWLGVWPLSFSAARVRRHGETLYLCDGDLALPLVAELATVALPLLQVAPFGGVGLWDGRALNLCWADTVLGRWAA